MEGFPPKQHQDTAQLPYSIHLDSNAFSESGSHLLYTCRILGSSTVRKRYQALSGKSEAAIHSSGLTSASPAAVVASSPVGS